MSAELPHSATAVSGNQQDEWERKRTIHLDGDRHETVMTERSGLFSIYCGCGWKIQDVPINDALSAEAGHCADVPHGPQSPPVTGPARTVEVSDRAGQHDPDVP